jgi:two-component system phosphate regulon response regulator PhoB
VSAAAIVVVEDEEDVQTLLTYNLRAAGFEITAASSVAAGRLAIAMKSPVVVVLDRMLPDGDGVELCAEVRADPKHWDVGVLVLTARGSEDDRLDGLEAGADDYVVKPFSVREVVARVRVLAAATTDRRAARALTTNPALLSRGRLVVDLERHEVRIDGAFVELRPLEFRLLVTLLEAPGRAFTRAELISRLWSDATPTPRVIDTHVKRLRERLGSAADMIETIKGAGYRLA